MSFELSVALVELSGSAGRVGEPPVTREALDRLERLVALLAFISRKGFFYLFWLCFHLR